jgi:hypothetical protein
MYAGELEWNEGGTSRSLKSKNKEVAENTWSQKIGVASAAEEWFESMMNSTREASSRLANDIQLGQLQDGATEIICTASNVSNTTDAACEPTPESNLVNSTSGIVSILGKDVHL